MHRNRIALNLRETPRRLLTISVEREVKRANRDLMQQVSKMDDMQKIDHLTKRSSELLADMRRLDKDNQKNKKRGDALQKERDANRSELSKTVGLKEKLEKLCRELQRDNNKMKVRLFFASAFGYYAYSLRSEREQRTPNCSEAQHRLMGREVCVTAFEARRVSRRKGYAEETSRGYGN